MANQKIKVLHIVQSLGIGGMESRISRLAFGLEGSEFEVYILSLRSPSSIQVALPPGTQHLFFDIPPGLWFNKLIQLAMLIRKKGFRIVHTHNWSTMFYGVLAAKMAFRPVVIHGEHGLNHGDLAGTPWKRRLAQKILARVVDWIVAVNPVIKNTIQTEWQVSESKIRIILNGVDLRRFLPDGNPGDSAFVLGTVARLDRVKNLDCLLQAIQIAVRNGLAPGLRLIIVGDGPLRSELTGQAAAYGISDRVEFVGENLDVSSWYGKFHVFVNSSHYEGMSNTILEAMACGLPVIASDVPGNAAWLDKVKGALLFRSGDASHLAERINTLHADKTMRAKMGQANREIMESEFDNRKFLKEYLEFYRSLF
jgi:glycosyltransferase involved in cell wall biosynthesis